MRILHVIPHYWPAVRYGGPIKSVHGLAQATAALGHEVHVYTTNVDGPGVSEVPTSEPVERDGVKVWYFPAGIGRRVFRSPAMDRALAATVASFDLVHVHYVWVWPTVAASRAARRHKVPYVLSPRGMLVADLIARKSSLAKRAWLALFDRANVQGAAAIHVTSAIEADALCALGLKVGRIATIANGIDMPSARPPGSGEDGAPYILFLGRISWKKGLDRLLRALPMVAGANLVIAGYDEGGYQADVERLAAELGVSHRVRFAGAVDGEAKWDLIGGALCLVLPSYNENFGMVALEAMAAGCPVVVSRDVGLADVVAKSGSGAVSSGEPADLAEAINRVVGSADLRAAMGRNGAETAAAQFGWPAIANEMQALYAACVKR